MSYCRFGTEDSDVYIYGTHFERGEGWAVHVSNDIDEKFTGADFQVRTFKEFLKLLRDLRDADIRVPRKVYERIEREMLGDVLDRIPEQWGKWIGCSSGWWPLVLETHEAIMKVDPNYEVHQVKEKFGGMRYYIQSEVPEAHDIADAADMKASVICEDCGEPGTRRGGGWIKTLCDVHGEGKDELDW